MTKAIATATVETFLAMARDAILTQADITAEERDRLRHVKLTYGAGNGAYRGVTFFGVWQTITETPTDAERTDFIEIAASAQESWVQLAGTLLHEYAHSLAGMGAGHGKEWKATCMRLGFQIRPAAAGQRYYLAIFKPALRQALYGIAQSLRDGTPLFSVAAGYTRTGTSGPCRAGYGTRGGKSRGAGSGSRLRLWECGCERPVKVRVASDHFDATCNVCGKPFERR